VSILRVHGMKPKYYHHELGGNFRLDALQAAVLSVKLPRLDGWSRARRTNAEFYDGQFRKMGLVEKGFIETPKAVYMARGDANHHIYNQYTLRVKDRDGLQAHLRSKDIGNEVYYPVPLHLQECFKGLGYGAGDFPVAEKAAAEVISIPIYPELTGEQKSAVIAEIAAFYEEK
jgi:dTDP-4-amino-4,6-dideoxygalactose transaminase